MTHPVSPPVLDSNETRPAPPVRGEMLAALVLVAIGVVFVTLYPFGFVRTEEVFRRQLSHAFGDPVDLLLPIHALPALLMAWLARGAFPRTRTMLLALSLACFLFVLEGVQVGVRYRHARAGDVIGQWIGIGLGFWTYPVAARLASHLRSLLRPIWVLALIAMVTLASLVVHRGQKGHRIERWDETFPLVLGDEYQGGRPWSGIIHRAGVYAGEARGPDPSGLAPSMVYDLAQGPESLGTIDIPLRTHDAVSGPDGLDLGRGGLAQTAEAATEISRAIERAGAGTFIIECTPGASEQTGPARLITLSKGPDYRNMTAAQEGRSLVLRVRTPRSGRNASGYECVWDDVFEAGRPVRLVVTSTGAHSRLWVNGEDRGVREHVTRLGDWMGIRSKAKSWIAGVVLFFPLGLIGAQCVRGAAGRWVVVGVAGAVPIGLALVTAQTMGLRLPISAVGVGAACLAVGGLVGHSFRVVGAGARRKQAEALEGAM